MAPPRVALDLQRVAVVLEDVRAAAPTRTARRHGGARNRAPVRLVEAQHERVGVLGALDRVEHEVRSSTEANESGTAARVRRSGALKHAASPRRPPRASRRHAAAARRRTRAGRCPPRDRAARRAQQAQSQLAAETAPAVLAVVQERHAEAMLGEVGPAVARNLVAGAIPARRPVRRAAPRGRMASRRWPCARAPPAGSRPSAACAPPASRSSCGTRACANPRRGARPGSPRAARTRSRRAAARR